MTFLQKIINFFEKYNPLYARKVEEAYQNFVEARQKWQMENKKKRARTLERRRYKKVRSEQE